MQLVHSECGGRLEIDRGVPPRIGEYDGHTDVYYGIKCNGCNERLGLLPNVDMAYHFVIDVANRREYAD